MTRLLVRVCTVGWLLALLSLCGVLLSAGILRLIHGFMLMLIGSWMAFIIFFVSRKASSMLFNSAWMRSTYVSNDAFRVRVPEDVKVIGKPESPSMAVEGNGKRRQLLDGSGGSGGNRRSQFLKRFDKNKDGRLDESERAALMEGFRRTGGGQGFGGGGWREERPPRNDSGPKMRPFICWKRATKAEKPRLN